MRAIKWALGNSILHSLASLALMILIIIYFGQHYHVTPRCDPLDAITVNATCVPERELNVNCTQAKDPCKVPYYLPEFGTCDPQQAIGGTACNDICSVPDAVTTVCDNTGTCAPTDPTECRGYCQENADCNASLPFNTFWIGVNDSIVNVPIYWNYQCLCYLNMAEQFVLDLFWFEDDASTGVLVGGVRCVDYLDPTFAETYKDCLTMTRYLLDPTLMPIQYYLNNSGQTSQFGLCVYTYNCAVLNQTALLPAKKRSIDGTTLQQQQRPALLKTLQNTVVVDDHLQDVAHDLVIRAQTSPLFQQPQVQQQQQQRQKRTVLVTT